MKKLINLLSLVMLLSVNVLTPMVNAGEMGGMAENGSGIAENGSGMAENNNESFRGSAATEESSKESEQLTGNEQDFFHASGASAMPQNDDSSSSKSEQSEGEGSSKGQTGNTQDFYPTSGASALPQNDDGDEKTPQNNGSDVQVPHNDNTPSFQTEGDGSEGSSEGESGNTQDYPTNEDSSFLSNLAQSIANLLNAPFMAPPAENQNGSGDSQGASCVGMDMANISHTVKNGIITLEWDAVDGDTVEVAIFDADAEGYKSLGTANMKDEKFSYKLQKDGEQNFLLTNGCGEGFRYKADVSIEFGTIAIPYPKDPTKGIILLDHNIGATDTGTGSDLEKKGYYYQWGNNYGFPLADPTATITFTDQKVNVSQYGPSNPYYGNAFYRPQANWALDNGAFTSKNLRGGGNDSTQNNWGYDKSTMTVIGAEDRQGPCPDGYHVPSAGEWAQLIAFYIGLYNIEHGTDLKIVQENGFNKFEGETEDVINDFINELLIPNSKMYNEKAELDTRAGLYTSLASSSPTLDTNTGKTWSFSVRKKVLNMRDNPRASAQAVRCFANEYVAENQTISFVSDGEEIDSQEVARGFFATKPSDPQKDGYMFAGWYENPDFSGKRFSFRTKIQSDLTLYAKWLEYDIIFFEDPANPGHGITIMDRNLGATTTGAGKNSDTSSYGYYYQWGNNYGFDPENVVYVDLHVGGATYDSQYDKKGYYSESFFINALAKSGYDYWKDSKQGDANHSDLRGGADDVNGSYPIDNWTDRQGPCPDGYHVPSQGEWTALIDMRWNTNSGSYSDYSLGTDYTLSIDEIGANIKGQNENVSIANDFADAFNVPFAGWIRWNGVGLKGGGSYVNMQSSSPGSLSFSRSFGLESVSNLVDSTNMDRYRTDGMPIRCFYDGYDPILQTISFESDGSVVDTQEVIKGYTGTQPDDPTRKGYKFLGWYENPDFSGDTFDFENTPIKSDITLYAKWKKNPGWSGRGNSRILNDEGDATHGSADDMTQSLTGKYIIPEDKQAEKWDMHQWAYDNGLTIYKPGEDAKFDQPLTRQQMAKISSVFGTNFLNQKADASEKKIYECSQYSDLDKSKGEMRGYVIQSCLMKNMGYAYDGVNLIKKFKPYDKLTVAQASVILSRMAWGNTYVISPKMWFEGHMYAAYDYGLIDDISDPSRIITRGEAFMMMYRLSQLMKSEK